MSTTPKAKKLTELTPAQRDRMGSFAQEWIQRGHRTRPLTEEEWGVWEAGARRCYEYAGIPFPATVVRVPSPLVGAFAAPIAAFLIGKIRRGQIGHSAPVRGAVGGAVGDAVGGAVDGAVGDAVDGAVRDAVGDAVRGAVDGAVGGAVDGAVRDAVDGAVGGAVDGAVGGAVGGAVDGAVGDAVRDAVDGAELKQAILSLWYNRLGGIHWSGWWLSYIAYFRDVAELQLDGDIWDRSRAYEDAQSAGWWWPFKDFVMVCDAPHTLHLEQVGPTGWGSHRLHCEDGPAVAWPGYELNFWHGTKVPDDFFAWDAERALSERNSEIRRCAIERLGWEKLTDRLILVAEAPDPGNSPHKIRLYDLPKDMAELYDEPARILIVQNASLDKGGHRRQFGLPVPARHADPVAAAADLFGIPVAAYRQLANAS